MEAGSRGELLAFGGPRRENVAHGGLLREHEEHDATGALHVAGHRVAKIVSCHHRCFTSARPRTRHFDGVGMLSIRQAPERGLVEDKVLSTYLALRTFSFLFNYTISYYYTIPLYYYTTTHPATLYCCIAIPD